MSRTPLEEKFFNSYRHMVQVCTNPNSVMYQSYASAGLQLDCEWDSYRSFMEDILTYLGPPPFKDARLVRKNMLKGYKLSNLEWTDFLTQQRRQRSCHPITYKGRTLLLTQWARELDISTRTIYNRIGAGETKPSRILYKGRLDAKKKSKKKSL